MSVCVYLGAGAVTGAIFATPAGGESCVICVVTDAVLAAETLVPRPILHGDEAGILAEQKMCVPEKEMCIYGS